LSEHAALLRLEGVNAFYGDLQALHDVAFEVYEREIAAVVGANAAGKTTTLRVISGTLPPRAGRVTFQDRDLTEVPAHRRVDLGIVQVPEGRRLFPFMTVRENLQMGSWVRRHDRAAVTADLERVLALFPLLRARKARSR